MCGFEGMAQRLIEIDFVDVSSTFFDDAQVSGGLEIVHNSMNRTFADSDQIGHFAQADVGLLGDADEYVGVVREERPSALVERAFVCHRNHVIRSR